MNTGIMHPEGVREALITRGYFRMEIPPVFTSAGLANKCGHLLPLARKMPPLRSGLPMTWPERYNASAYGFRRREMRIPNPANQIIVVEIIANRWQEIRCHYGMSDISESKHKIHGTQAKHVAGYEPAIRMSMSKTTKKERLLQMAGHSHILKTDISQFFPSVYTHSIPWALHGKDRAKGNRDLPKGERECLWGDCLDVALRNGNGTQTTGIPIGPATSHIVGEIIMAAIDGQLQKELGARRKTGFRHVDDYFLCFDSQKDAELALAELRKAAGEYELVLNDRKTQILQSIDHTEELWSRRLREMWGHKKTRILPSFKKMLKQMLESPNFSPFLAQQANERTWLVDFASESFALAREYPNESVIKYALKLLRQLPLPSKEWCDRTEPLCEENWSIYESILVRAMTDYPYTVDIAAAILSECDGRYPLNKGKLSGTVSSFIKRHAPLEHHSEVAWALWLAKALNLEIKDDGVARCLPMMNSSICALLALDNARNGVIKSGMDESPWRARIKEGLNSQHWLLAYEAPLKGWLGDTAHIDKCGFFSGLSKLGVRFYDEKTITALAVADDAFYSGNTVLPQTPQKAGCY